MTPFATLWDFIASRSDAHNFPLVQERSELEHVFNLASGCQSYLEIGTAEGNSLHVMARALCGERRVAFVDTGEQHTADRQNEIVTGLRDEGFSVIPHYGISQNRKIIRQAMLASYDIVMIDGGHSFPEVVADAFTYGLMARGFIFFHDICLPEVRRAFDFFTRAQQYEAWQVTRFINSDSFGYGIVRLNEHD